MDNDDIRHNQLTIHNKWNNSVAILAGDAILALAFKRLNNAGNDIKELFNSALIAVCEGQALDIEYESLDNITTNQYLEMINLKTGHMLGLSAQLGGLLSNLDFDAQMQLRKYGNLLGKAFQIQDDLLEIVSDSNIMGKSLESDFILGKKTLLMIDAKKRFPDIIKDILDLYKKDQLKAFNLYKELLVSKGIIEKCIDNVQKTFLEADETINGLMPNNTLMNFTKMVSNRKY
jgi:geranylgeranyl diphosphate synthase type II